MFVHVLVFKKILFVEVFFPSSIYYLRIFVTISITNNITLQILAELYHLHHVQQLVITITLFMIGSMFSKDVLLNS